MNRFISGIGAALLVAVTAFSSVGSAAAAPVVIHQPLATSDVELAQHRDRHRPQVRHHRDRRERFDRRRDRAGYWHGHRGYRNHRPGYRRHSDGYYYAPSVFKLYIR
ncbi:hypothetical protein IFT84_15310 [Rhizobium sp. CFBP 8762]|uniref:hypothetical protein n=1 Tax=Rhizobium sp. CFBP 8762 TaxID=2775279 RepID=UPI00177F85AB|nr:hypothetical protein [Rhizobium sp. CFBP 8762]MBD8555876.1 hypothetical protein [Rhizobium sp. CFBP 8762]